MNAHTLLRGRAAAPLVFAFLAVTLHAASAAKGAALDPARTATVFVHGFNVDGAQESGVFGADTEEPLLEEIAALAGLPVLWESGPTPPENAVGSTTYYGDTPPDYYGAGDMEQLGFVTMQSGGGIPRYALIVAKYVRNVLDRTGAQQINLVSASMGSLVTRWLIEKNVEGLAGDGKIARWLSLEGVVSGNWAASQENLVSLWSTLRVPPIDVEHMSYDWVERHIQTPRSKGDSSYYSHILMGQTGSTDDAGNEGLLSLAMIEAREFQPNDGVQGADDAVFQTFTQRSLHRGLPPMVSMHHATHQGLADHKPAWAHVALFLTESRRVTMVLRQVEIDDLHEGWLAGDAEVAFQSEVTSPWVEDAWGITGPLTERHIDGASVPLHLFSETGKKRNIDQVVFDALVHSGETELEVDLWAEEVDWDSRYGIADLGEGSGDDRLGRDTLRVSTTEPGTYRVKADDWSGKLEVAITDYLTAGSGCSLETGRETIKKATCSKNGTAKITLKNGAPGAPASVEISSADSLVTTFKPNGRAKAKIKGLEPGQYDVTVTYGCGATESATLDCR